MDNPRGSESKQANDLHNIILICSFLLQLTFEGLGQSQPHFNFMAILDIYWPVLLAVKTIFQLINSDYMSKGRMIVCWHSGLFLHLEIFPYEGVDRACSPHMKYKTWNFRSVQFSSVAQSDTLWPHGLQDTRPPCLSPTPGVYPNSCPLNRWCHPAISSSVVPFSSCPQSFPASRSFQMSQVLASGGQIIGVSTSASVLPMNIQDLFPLG